MNYSIRSANPEMASEICDLLIRSLTEVCFPDYGNDKKICEEWLANKTPENISAWIADPKNINCIACHEDKIIGFVLMTISGELLLNYLLPEYLHRGIGMALLNKAEEAAIQQGINEIYVNSTITAKEFYLRNGFISYGDPIKVGKYLGEFPLIKRLDNTGKI